MTIQERIARELLRISDESVEWDGRPDDEKERWIKDADAILSLFDAEQGDLRRKLEGADYLWCPRCGGIFHDSDMENHPEEYWACEACGAIEHRKCRGPLPEATHSDCTKPLRKALENISHIVRAALVTYERRKGGDEMHREINLDGTVTFVPDGFHK